MSAAEMAGNGLSFNVTTNIIIIDTEGEFVLLTRLTRISAYD
jgi:hypothetical protein